MKKYGLQPVLALLITLLFCATASAIELVDANWLKQNLGSNNVKIVDVQNKSNAYDKEHIPGAVKVYRYADLSNVQDEPPTLYPTAEQFESLLQRLGIGNDTVIVAYDDNFSFFASRFLVLMEIYGHDTNKLKLLDGGIVNWKAEGNKVEETTTEVTPSNYKIGTAREDIMISWSTIYHDVVLGMKPEILLLDTRPEKEFGAENIRGIRGGYIPGAINVTGSNANNAETHKFKSRDEIQKMYADAGVTADKEIYEYCHSGDRAAHAYIQLRHLLGYQNVRLYPGGWNEWNTKLFLPVAGQVWLWEVEK